MLCCQGKVTHQSGSLCGALFAITKSDPLSGLTSHGSKVPSTRCFREGALYTEYVRSSGSSVRFVLGQPLRHRGRNASRRTKKGVRWTRQDGGCPRVNIKYKYKKGGHGGGRGSGVLHCKLQWLQWVYWKYFCKSGKLAQSTSGALPTQGYLRRATYAGLPSQGYLRRATYAGLPTQGYLRRAT